MTTAFQRIMRRTRSSIPSSPGNGGSCWGGKRIDVARLNEARQTDLQLARALEKLPQQVVGAFAAGGIDHAVERVEPLLRFLGIEVGKLSLEAAEQSELETRLVLVIRGRLGNRGIGAHRVSSQWV
jgi:hypothetical protein